GVTAGWPRRLRRRARLVHAVRAVPWDELGQRHHHPVAVGAWPAADLQQRVAHVAPVLGAVAAGALSAGGDHADHQPAVVARPGRGGWVPARPGIGPAPLPPGAPPGVRWGMAGRGEVAPRRGVVVVMPAPAMTGRRR